MDYDSMSTVIRRSLTQNCYSEISICMSWIPANHQFIIFHWDACAAESGGRKYFGARRRRKRASGRSWRGSSAGSSASSVSAACFAAACSCTACVAVPVAGRLALPKRNHGEGSESTARSNSLSATRGPNM